MDKETALVAFPSQNKKQNIQEKMDHANDNSLCLHSFVTFSYNPLKATVLIIRSLVKIKNIHPNLDFDQQIEEFSKLALSIIGWTENIEEVRYMLYNYCLNGYQVIDMVSYYHLKSIIVFPKVSIIISNLWTNPYLLCDSCDRSSVFKCFNSFVSLDSDSTLEDEKDTGNKIIDNFKRPHHILNQYKPDKDLYRSDMFTYNAWKKSIFTNFFTE